MPDQFEKQEKLKTCLERAKMFQEGEQFAQAAEQLQEAIRIAPDCWPARRQLALVYLEDNDLYHMAQELLRWQKEDSATYPDDFVSKHSFVANRLTSEGLDLKIKTGDAERAMSYYHLALQFDAAHAEALYNLGDSLHDSGRLQEAKSVFNELVRLQPTYADAWNTLGMIKEDMGDLRAAIECYNKAVECDPNLGRAQNNLRRAIAKRWQ
jgi:tetratricopeptide (TPR) repeat protein